MAEAENKYLLQQFEHFEVSYEWPHTIIIGGGETKTFEN